MMGFDASVGVSVSEDCHERERMPMFEALQDMIYINE